jgi:hypothetical protein
MISHIVIFWVDKPHAENRDALLKGCGELLPKIPGVLEFRAGVPVPSPRAVVDDSFAVGISMVFADQAAADTYQSHPIHLEFIEKYAKPYARRLVVYDWKG